MNDTRSLRLEFEWEPSGDAVRAPELRATWSRFEAWVHDECVTLVEDRATRSYRRSINVALYPLAEWIAFNWWQLAFDGRETGLSERIARRSMRSAGEGFLWPDLRFRASGAFVNVVWAPRSLGTSAAIRYLNVGQRWIDRDGVVLNLQRLVQAVLSRLEEAGVHDTPLQGEWVRIESMQAGEVEFCHLAARLGLDPYSEGIDLAESIEHVAGSLSEGVLLDFLDAAPPDQLEESLEWVTAAFETDEDASPPADREFDLDLVDGSIADSSPDDARPWVTGYAAAKALRHHLGLNPSDPFLDRMPVAVMTAGRSEWFSGAGRRHGDGKAASVVIAETVKTASRRFAGARSLWHASKEVANGKFLLTRSPSLNQAAGRAFAAELLAPAEGIKAMVRVDPRQVVAEDISEMAEHFNTSEMTILHQIENQLRVA